MLTAGGTRAILKLWLPGGQPEVIWQADFGGRFSRMRDVEVADVFGSGERDLVVATHDQGVVAVVRPDERGGFRATEPDRKPDTFVHEIEVGDLDGDGTLEVYATPSRPQRAPSRSAASTAPVCGRAAPSSPPCPTRCAAS